MQYICTYSHAGCILASQWLLHVVTTCNNQTQCNHRKPRILSLLSSLCTLFHTYGLKKDGKMAPPVTVAPTYVINATITASKMANVFLAHVFSASSSFCVILPPQLPQQRQQQTQHATIGKIRMNRTPTATHTA